MNCDKCQELISASVDGELSAADKAALSAHMSVCEECAALHEDFSVIANFFDEPFADDSAPPNSQAMWCRINNIIESEVEQSKTEVSEEEVVSGGRRGWFGHSINFSPAQLVATILMVAFVSSLLTLVGFKNLAEPGNELAGFEAEPSVFEKMLAKLGIAETPAQRAERRVEERKSAIEYWSKRVQKRRIEWDTDTRVTFDRNMDVIDKAVKQYTLLLKENPQDEISTEMLDSALNEKMELLREFSEL